MKILELGGVRCQCGLNQRGMFPADQTAKGLEEDEYLSGMKKTDRFAPVITLVVYYGEKPWDGAVSLHGMLNIPEEMKAFVNDYKILLVEARENSLTLHNMKNVAFFNLMKLQKKMKQRALLRQDFCLA